MISVQNHQYPQQPHHTIVILSRKDKEHLLQDISRVRQNTYTRSHPLYSLSLSEYFHHRYHIYQPYKHYHFHACFLHANFLYPSQPLCVHYQRFQAIFNSITRNLITNSTPELSKQTRRQSMMISAVLHAFLMLLLYLISGK